MRSPLLTGAVALLLAACSSPSEPDDRWLDPAQITYAPQLGVDLAAMTRTGTGLYVRDLEPGLGDTASVGAYVRVSFTCWLPDGTEVLTDSEEIEPLGWGLAIRAFDEGIVGMRIGGVRQLVAPPHLAFGRAGNRDYGVPPLTTVIFRVERLTDIAHSRN